MRLRAVAADLPDAYAEKVLWRGMKNLGLDRDFLTQGGTDFACVSTTEDQNVAVHFADSALPLAFKVVAKTPMARGADISFLSVFPEEKETLYPPLTYLHPVGNQMEMVCGVELLVVTVEPTMA